MILYISTLRVYQFVLLGIIYKSIVLIVCNNASHAPPHVNNAQPSQQTAHNAYRTHTYSTTTASQTAPTDITKQQQTSAANVHQTAHNVKTQLVLATYV